MDKQTEEALKSVKIGTPEQAKWTEVKQNLERQNMDMKVSMEINNHVLKHVEEKLKEYEQTDSS